MKKFNSLIWALVVLMLSLPIYLTRDTLAFKSFGVEEIMRLLGSLFLISLLLERASEVFVTTWRRPSRVGLDLKIQNLESKISKPNLLEDNKKLSLLIDELEAVKKEQTEYMSDTQRIAVGITLAFGLLISAVGIRSLHIFVDAPNLTEGFQAVVFRLIDVFLTGGLIAGGSKGIHKLSQVFGNFMDTTAKRVKG